MIMEQDKYYCNNNQRYQHVDNPDQEVKAPAVKKPVLTFLFEKFEQIDNGPSPKTVTAQYKGKEAFEIIYLLNY